MLINMAASIEEINNSLDYATNFFRGDTNKMYDETKSIEKQISELLEAHRTKTGTCIFKINVVWAIPFISNNSKNGEAKIEALRINSRTNVL